MRLTEFQTKTIKNAVTSSFGDSSQVYLFGSRVDDSRKGGDIDLLIITSLKGKDMEYRKLKTISKIQLAMGDQKIDLLTADPDLQDPPLIIREALKGIEL